MNIQWLYYFNLGAMLFSVVSAVLRYKTLDHSSRIYAFLICTAFVCEVLAFFVSRIYHNNMPVYAIYSLIEFGIICIYFNNIIDIFFKKKIGYYIGAAGILWGIINLIFFQGLKSLNSHFLFFEGLCIIIMALIAFFRFLVVHDQLRLYKYPHFWFTTIMILFWSITFLNWSLYGYVLKNFKDMIWIMDDSILIINIITYICISCVFIMYPRMHESNE